MVEVEPELVAVGVEALVLGVVEGGVPLQQRHDPGVIVVREGGGEFSGLVTAERGVGVREVQGADPVVVALVGAVADHHPHP